MKKAKYYSILFRLLLNLWDKINSKRSGKYVSLSRLRIYYTLKNIKQSCKNNEFKISIPMWHHKTELLDRPCSVSDIQNHFEYNIKNQEAVTNNHSIRINVNKMQNEIVFKIKTGCYLQLLTPKMMKLPRRTNVNIIKDRNGENVPYLEIT